MAGKGLISEVHALTYVLLNKAEKRVPFGEFVGTAESKML